MNLAPRRCVVFLITLVSLPALLPTLGCGRAEYEADVSRAVARLKIENEFKTLETTPTLLAAWKGDQGTTGTKVTFRKPLIYNIPPFNSTTMNPRNQAEPLKPQRLYPPFLQNLPGLYQTWEKSPVSGRNDSVTQLYVGAQTAEPGLTDRLLGELKAALPDLADLAWGDMQVQTTEQGKFAKWQILSFDHEQEFWHASDAEAMKVGGTMLLLVREEQGRQVFIIARWSKTAGDLHQRRQEVLAAAGTVQVATNVKID